MCAVFLLYTFKMFQTLQKIIIVLLIPILICTILIYGKPFLAPIIIASLLSLLFIPLSKLLEEKNIPAIWASFTSILLLLMIISFFVLFIKWQIANVWEDAEKIEKEVLIRFQDLRKYIADHFGITILQQQEIIDEQSKSVKTQAGSFLVSNVSSVGRLLVDFILIIVYTFLFIHYRKIIRTFIIHLTPEKEKDNTLEVIHRAQTIAFKYLKGMSLMIITLWIMYGIGFTLVGIEHPLFFAILCGVLEIVPFVGNLTGTALTVLMTAAQGGSSGMIIGIFVTYGFIQFIQSYFLEPLIVGSGVRINPLFTILSLVAGEFIWGIPGMIVAIPVLGILKVIFEHVQTLKPVSSLVGIEKDETTKAD